MDRGAAVKYSVVMFDLDGTLTDPKEGITRSVQYALEKCGISVSNRDDLIPFIGPPLKDSFRSFYSMSDEEAVKAVAYYREYFGVTGLYENRVYPGIRELLAELTFQGCINLVVTSKPTVYAQKIIAYFDLCGYFDAVIGSNMDLTMTDKSDLVASARSQYPDIPIEQFVMIGDRMHDIIGARKNNIASIGVLWGYGGVQELIESRSDHFAEDISVLQKLLSS